MADFTDIDFYLERNSDGIYDLVVEGGKFKTLNNFDTALQMIIFCERRADESEVPLPQYRRGWWGNLYLTETNFEIGSKFWLLRQERRTTDILNKAITYMQEACQWLVDDNHLKSVTVTGELKDIDGIRLFFDFVTFDNKVESRWFDLWKNTGNRIK